MKRSFIILTTLLWTGVLHSQNAQSEWITIPTHSLDSWIQPAAWWSSQDGVIVAESDGGKGKPKVDYLLWSQEIEGEFEMELEYRILSKLPADAGICLKAESAKMTAWNIPCYQVELDTGPAFRQATGKNFGNIHDGKRRVMVLRNLTTRIDANGEKTEIPFKKEFDPQKVYRNPPEWNACHIRVTGDRVQVTINGTDAVQIIDEDVAERPRGNKIALQYRPGTANRFELRGLKYRKIKTSE